MKIQIRYNTAPLPGENAWMRYGGYFCLVMGALMLGYVGFALLDAQLFQAGQSRQMQQALIASKPALASATALRRSIISPLPEKSGFLRAEPVDAAGIGRTSLGRIEIGTIGLTAMILEGTDARTLRRAVGHVPGTPLPGRPGNVALTGHRDTFFRPLRNIRKDDEIRFTTLNGSFRYRVDFVKVVNPWDMEVLDDSEDAILTLVTCYPFYYVGPAPKRFIVRAHKIPG